MSSTFLLRQLIKRDIQNRYVGSMLGFVWVFLQPIAHMAILWFVFTQGFHAKPLDGHTPYITWFAAGFIPWIFFSETLMVITNVFHEYGYLIKKSRFSLEILPLSKLISSLVIHAIFLVFLLFIAAWNGTEVSGWWFQLPYYLFALVVFILAFGFVTATLQVFLRDTAHIVALGLQLGFWATPIAWDIGMLRPSYQSYVQLNPLFYIVNGYRESLLYHVPFWHSLHLTLYFWMVTSMMIILGAWLYKKLRPHFSDVL